ncbi:MULTISPECIES: TetR family transcriptional regulator [unclassified Frankia]|uniref:acyl-CoA-like ligand-binding transcription factor n=1 Tax=unclassified Frankia TaxID=2632575 RepID=UPI002AD44654|nr:MULTISPECIES: TetR family transcriptional regulator [unclassified Frankia]
MAQRTDPDQPQAGMRLRERKRAVVRAALSDAALRLAIERGLEHVLVADIAAEAGVSPRTFNNYFSSKEEAVVAPAFDRTMHVIAAFEQRPAAEPLWQAVTRSIVAQFPTDDPPDTATTRQARLIAENPGLWSEQLKMYATIESLLADAIARRLGVERHEDLLPGLVAAAAIGASRVAFDHWSAGATDSALRSAMTQALDQTGAGFPDATSGRPSP